MTMESLGTASLNLTVDTRGIEVGIDRAKSKVAGFSTAAQQEYQKYNAAQKKVVDGLNKQADTFSMTRAEVLAYNAALKTSGAVQQELLAKIAANNAAVKKGGIEFNQYGLSAKQTTAALRQVPAQMTDIFVSLQGGQNPLTVLLQQGGQLKDVFGGVAPAAKALGGAILGLVNPVTITLGVFAALAVAINEGQNEALAFNRAIALTGNAAGVTTSQLEAMAAQIDATSNVTTGAASAALAQVAATGQFTGDQIRTVAQAALDLQEATGRAIEKTVADFVSLRGDPLDAILKLNGAIGDGTNVIKFLTPEQLRMIENLKEQGRTADAAAIAIQAYANAIAQRTPEVVKNLGTIETVWKVITQTAKEAWDEMLGIGRDETVAQRVHSLQEQIARAAARGFDTGELDAKLKELTDKSVRAHPPASGGGAGASVVDSQQAQEALKLKDQYLTKEEQKKRAILELDRLKAQYTAQEYKNIKAGIEERFKPPKATGAGAAHALANAEVKQDLQAYKDALVVQQATIQQGTQLLQANYAARNVSAEDYFAKQRGFLQEGTKDEEAALEGQIAILQARNVKGKDAVDTVREIAQMEAQLAKVRAEGSTKLSLLTIQEQEFYEKRTNAIEDYRDRLVESNVALQVQTNAAIARIGMGSREAEQQERINEIYINQALAVAELNKQLARKEIDQTQFDAEVRAQQEATDEEVRIVTEGFQQMLAAQGDWHNGFTKGLADWLSGTADVASQISSITNRALNSAADAFAEFALTGKLEIKKLLASILTDIVKFLAQRAIMQFLTAFLPSSFGGASAGGGGGNFGIPTMGSGSGSFFRAKGDPFPGGTTLPVNSILTKPTLFRYAKGAAFGEAGEKGAEAVMPLERGPDGKLGVRLYGGGAGSVSVYVETNVYSNGSTDTSVTTNQKGEAYKELTDHIQRVTKQAVMDEMRPGGALHRAGVRQ